MPRSSSGFSSTRPKTLSQAASPRCRCSFTPGEALERLQQHARGRDELDEAAHVRLAREGLLRGEVDDRGHRARDQELRHRHRGGGRGRLLHVVAADELRGLREAPALVLLAAEDAHHALVGDRLVEHLGDAADGLLAGAARVAQAPAEVAHREGERRDHDEGDERELPVGPQQDGEERGDRDRVAHQRGEHARGGRGDLRDVVREARHEPRRGHLVEVGGRQAQHVGEHRRAQVQDDLVVHPLVEVAGGEARQPAHQEDGHHPQRDEERELAVAVHEELVHQRPGELHEGRVREPAHDHRGDRREEGGPVGPHVLEEPRVEGAAVGLRVGHPGIIPVCRRGASRTGRGIPGPWPRG